MTYRVWEYRSLWLLFSICHGINTPYLSNDSKIRLCPVFLTTGTGNYKPHKFVPHLQNVETLYFMVKTVVALSATRLMGAKMLGETIQQTYCGLQEWGITLSEKIKRLLTLVMLDLIPAFEECQKLSDWRGWVTKQSLMSEVLRWISCLQIKRVFAIDLAEITKEAWIILEQKLRWKNQHKIQKTPKMTLTPPKNKQTNKKPPHKEPENHKF